MPDFFDDTDVKDTDNSSPSEDVNNDGNSSTSSDVNSDSSTGDNIASQSVPYDRFKEKVDEVNRYKTELESLRNKNPVQEEDEWDFLKPKQKPIQTQEQPPQIDPEQLKDKLRDEFLADPGVFMRNAFNFFRTEERKKERQLKQIPDFNKYENAFYEVPDEMVSQVMQDPETIRFLLAFRNETAKNGKPANSSTASIPNQSNGNNQDILKTLPPDVQEQILTKARQEVMSKMNLRSGMTGEHTQASNRPSTDEPELDESALKQLRAMGINVNDEKTRKELAKNLQNFLQGR